MKKLVILTLAAGAALIPAAAVAQPAPPPPPPMHHPGPVMHHPGPGMRHHGPVRVEVHRAPPVVSHHGAPNVVVTPHDGPYDMGWDDEDGYYEDYGDGYEGDYPPPPPPPYGHPGYGYGHGGYGYAPGGMITVTETTVKTYGCDCVEVEHAPVRHFKKNYRSKSHHAPRKRVRHYRGERG